MKTETSESLLTDVLMDFTQEKKIINLFYDTTSFTVFGLGKWLVISNLCLKKVSFVNCVRKYISFWK